MKNKRRVIVVIVAAASIVFGCALLTLCIWLRASFLSADSPPEPSPAAPTPPPASAAPTPSPTPEPTPGPLIVIDPGHQLHGDPAPEPIGPGAQETKPRVSDGAQGVVTGVPEYEHNLAVSLLLRDELLARGYRVLLTRGVNEVSLSNAERAEIANERQAAAFVRIHANAADDPEARGIMTICQTQENPYHPELYAQSRSLAEAVLDAMGAALGYEEGDRVLWETDGMSGINHALVPTVIVETGYLSNPEEDRLLADPDYRARIAAAIADGLDAWFAAG